MGVLQVVNLVLLGLEVVIIGAMVLVMLAWRFCGRDPSWFFRPMVRVGERIVDLLNRLGDPPGWS